MTKSIFILRFRKNQSIQKCKSIQADKHKCANSFRYSTCAQYDNLNSFLLTSDNKPIILPLICERKQVNQFPLPYEWA
ncbi:hypothetical protein [Helicobacter sp. MIT 01-3238]|uniref:hypothetical protein n=1 Tax=Helicobacter sp. MIT 01-3238 TaxID=398627 RepID=UPI000E1FA651|nr:hypothetical protein [Helicobacter sp. MIT 01-3238]RDU51736.1 hypothetical protein CQA40_09205 [Helicobacter sp. MIT 01-3238]